MLKRKKLMNWTPKQIKALRKALGETQEDFAAHFRLGLGAVRSWEQGWGTPSGPVEVILEQLEEKRRARELTVTSA